MTVHVGRNIAYLRKLKGMHQKEVADKLDMSQQNYSIIEQKPQVADDLLEQIARILDYPVDAFVLPDLDQKINNIFQKNGDHASVITYKYEASDQVISLYEQLIKEKDNVIHELRKRIELLETK